MTPPAPDELRPGRKPCGRLIRNATGSHFAQAVAASALVAVTLTGCLGDETTAPVSMPTAAAGAVAGGDLVVGIVAPQSIDPALVATTDVGGMTVVRTMCDSLLARDPATSTLKPAIAESWRVLDGGARIAVRLRADVRFSDGRKLAARDVAASLARVAAPDTVSPVAELLEHVGGYTELRDRKVERDELTGVQVVSARDLEIVLSRRDAQYVDLLATTVGVPVPRDAPDQRGFAERPVCVGPYALAKAWRTGDSTITLERSSSYYGGNTAFTRGGAGWADRITFMLYPTREKAEAAFRRGEVDVAPVANDRLAEARGIAGAGVETAPTGTLEYVGLPFATPPFDDARVRRALSQALDRARIAAVVYRGGRVPATSLFPPNLDDRVVEPDACGDAAPDDGDVDSARATLRASGVQLAGLTVPLYFNDEFHNRALMTEVAAQWQSAFRLRSRLVPMPFDAYLARGTSGTGFDGPFRLAHAAPYLDLGEFLGPLFSTETIGTENLSRFSIGRFDYYLRREARQAISIEDQRDRYANVHRGLCAQVPIVPVVWGTASYLGRPTEVGLASGRLLDRATATPLLREVYVR